ncbi:MAG: HAMP domain-containing sensor histidine kinase [Herbinix sp.]|nr:HAMP domain-containing sensor histidine kinase [Herbinix sp.]
MFKSIKVRLTVTICGILLVVFTIQMAANFLLAERYYVYQKTRMMKEVNKQIINLANTTDENIVVIIRSLVINNNLEILLADENLELIYSNRIMPANPDPRINGNEFDFEKYPKSYYKTSEPTIIKTDLRDGDRIRLLSKIEREDKTYYLVIRLSVKSISADMKSTNLFILYISTFAIAAGVFMVYFISKQFARPIENINKVAVHISNLDFSVRANEFQRRDEIGSLAVNINKMSDRLEENIVSLKEANKKLKYDIKYMSKIDEQRVEFIANVSHELKTPLAILSGYTEMLNNDVPGIDKTFYYETILDETSKMDVLIKNLLNLSNMENMLTNINPEEIDISKLAEQIYRKSVILMDNKEIISEFCSAVCNKALVDPLYIEEAINNYLSNAIFYTQKGHKIKMKVEQPGDDIVISVFNEGINIEEANLEKIWNSFYREDKSRTRTSQNNVGLGLYIVRTIMNAHQGKYGVINKKDGVEFWLSVKSLSIDN